MQLPTTDHLSKAGLSAKDSNELGELGASSALLAFAKLIPTWNIFSRSAEFNNLCCTLRKSMQELNEHDNKTKLF